MSTIINTRSPYFITASGDEPLPGDYTTYWTLFIWAGDITAVPVTPQYSLSQNTVDIMSTIEVGELVNDFVSTRSTDVSKQGVWVLASWDMYNSSNVVVDTGEQTYLAFKGYGSFDEGANPSFGTGLMQTTGPITIPTGERLNVPVNTELVTRVEYYLDNALVIGANVSDTTISGGKILYSFVDTGTLGAIDEVRVITTTGTITIPVRIVDPCKYEPVRITFVNKFGALQTIWFFAKTRQSLRVSRDIYTGNILQDNNTYAPSDHVAKTFNIYGAKSLTLNTGFVDEDYIEVIEQLMLSLSVWFLRPGGTTLSVNVSTTGVEFKTRLNNKLINYTIQFDAAHGEINNIR